MTTELHLHGRPDDFHHHLRDGDALQVLVPIAARQFARCIVMPNLVPPITTTAQALAYRDRIVAQVPDDGKDSFTPLMTLYLTDNMDPDEVRRAAATGYVFAVKLYPAGATTNSDSGVTDLAKVRGVLEAMSDVGMPLLLHGEVTDPKVDIYDREHQFIEQILRPLVADFPTLKIVMEHITTQQAVEFIATSPNNVAATITVQHLLYNRNALLSGGLHPHNYCLPILKAEEHRQALLRAIASGSKKFFLGTDSAPHVQSKKEGACCAAGCFTGHAAMELYARAFESIGMLDNLQAFACENGADFYGIPRNKGHTFLRRESWQVPASYQYENGALIPFNANETVEWKLVKQSDE